MSHTTQITHVPITCLQSIQDAVDHLVETGVDCHLDYDSTPRAYYDNQQGMGKADAVLRIPQAQYDVGFYAQEDGTFEARTDLYGGSVQKILGAPVEEGITKEAAAIGKFYQAYNCMKLYFSLQNQGKAVTKTIQDDGTVILVAA